MEADVWCYIGAINLFVAQYPITARIKLFYLIRCHRIYLHIYWWPFTAHYQHDIAQAFSLLLNQRRFLLIYTNMNLFWWETRIDRNITSRTPDDRTTTLITFSFSGTAGSWRRGSIASLKRKKNSRLVILGVGRVSRSPFRSWVDSFSVLTRRMQLIWLQSMYVNHHQFKFVYICRLTVKWITIIIN